MNILHDPLPDRWLAWLHNACWAINAVTLLSWAGAALGALPNNKMTVAVLTMLLIASGLGIVAARKEIRRRGFVEVGSK